MVWRQRSFEHVESGGRLYIVGTPIGNLEDMTIRAVNTLREVAVIAAEDTRQTRKLTSHFDITTPLVSYREQNHREQADVLMKRLEAGDDVALVSDAGLPTVSDPGAHLVKEAIARHIPVIPIPGANAALTALVASGLNTDAFVFLGFLPRQQKACTDVLRQWEDTSATVIVYEAPHRLVKTLRYIQSEWGNRRAVVARELTKLHEEWVRGTLDELIDWFGREQPRGECCIVISGNEQPDVNRQQGIAWWHELTLREHIEHWLNRGNTLRDAVSKVAHERQLNKRDVYNYFHQS